MDHMSQPPAEASTHEDTYGTTPMGAAFSGMATTEASTSPGLLTASRSPATDQKSTGVYVVGLGTPVFASIHGVAIASLLLSIVASLLVILLMTRKLWQQGRGVIDGLQKLPIGERLIIYLALGDLLFSVTHTVDHALMLAASDNPPRRACITMAFFMLSLYYSPSIIALLTAMNAFAMIVLKRKINFGRYDWRLLVTAFCLPAFLMAIAASLGFLGESGIACSFYFGSRGGRVVGNIFSVTMVLIFVAVATCYVVTALKMTSAARNAAPLTSGGGGGSGSGSGGPGTSTPKYYRVARVMMIFAVAYLSHTWSVTIYYMWGFFGQPALAMVYLVVIFVNMGGVFNAVAYTVIRRRYAKVDATESDVGSGPT